MLMQNYNYQTDIELERLVMEKYGLTMDEKALIVKEMNRLPDLSAINNMKVEV